MNCGVRGEKLTTKHTKDMKRKAYPEYKPSGVEWLGDVPEHWGVKPLKYLFVNFDNKRIPLAAEDRGSLEKIYPYYGASGIIDYVDDYIYDETLILVAEDGANLLSRSTPLAFRAEGKYWVNNHAHILRPIFNVITYWESVLQIFDFTPYVSGSAQPKLTSENLGSFVLPLPPLSEQQSIAAFLDCETGRIDTLIGKKKKLMELLKEKRTALISRAVTKGLNASVKMKPSGVEWLGEVPEHWDVRKLKHTSQLFGRIGFRGYTTDDLVDELEGAITLSPSNMSDGELHFEKCTYISWEKYNESPEIQIHPYDVIIVKTGSTFGKVAYVRQVEHPVTLNPQLAVFKQIRCDNRFFYYYISAPYIQDQISLSNTGSTIPTMTQQTIIGYAIPLPSLPEQRAIAAFLDRETSKIDTLISKVETAIEKLKEYRTALISAAVTGKIDVRETV